MERKVTLDRALAIIDAAVSPLPPETVEVMMSAGRVLAERVHSWVDMPGSNIAALDGFALRAADVKAAGTRIAIVGASTFSAPYDRLLNSGTCVAVNTGAVIPEGADAVAALEQVTRSNEEIVVAAALAPGRGIKKKAEDFRVGESVVDQGEVLTPGRVALLIAAGWSEVKAVRVPRVRVIAAGDELKYPGQMLTLGQVYPSAAGGIVAWFKNHGVADMRLNLVADDSLDILEALPEPGVVDMIVTLGGTGESDFDVMFDSLAQAGAEFLFQGVAARPGRNTLLGMLDTMPVICLPGGPGAADMMFHFLVRRVFAALMGMGVRDLPVLPATLDQPVDGRPELERLVRVKLEDRADGLFAVPTVAPGLHHEIAIADGVIRVPAGDGFAAGAKVTVRLTG
jgi:molybdopterin molybdotransferase